MNKTYKSNKPVGKEGNGSAPKNGVPSKKAVLEGLAHEYGERAFQFAYRLSGNVEEAKNLVQEALRRTLSNWHSYDASRTLDAWFFTILRNAFLDARKRYGYRRSLSLDAHVEGLDGITYAEWLQDADMSPLGRMERQETANGVRMALEALSKDHRDVLTLCYIEGFPYEQAADSLGIPCGTVRSRLARARETLRRSLPRFVAL